MESTWHTCAVVACVLGLGACVEDPGPVGSGTTQTETTGIPMLETGTETSGEVTSTTEPPFPDLSGGWETDTEPDPPCGGGDGCKEIDLLFVIDNSGTMAQAQAQLAAVMPLLFEQLLALQDENGLDLEPDVNIMFTTTDLDHPLCQTTQPEGYSPSNGGPRNEPCIERLDDFTGLGDDPLEVPEICEASCPIAVGPVDPFVHFANTLASLTNVPGNNIPGALGCLAPQGINGCGYEAPLEAMIQGINPTAAWNTDTKPFIREGATLAIVILSDEYDCSVRTPDGYAYFTDPRQTEFWQDDPDTGTKTAASSAVCWNAGVDCGAPDNQGVYADCDAVDYGVLHPTNRYINYLRDELIDDQGKEVVMLGILGVPPVTEHAELPPYEPLTGGVADLVYRDWLEADILPDDPGTPATKTFEFGVGPGCTGKDGMGGFDIQATPPARIREVCEALDGDDEVRCCLESICDDDYSAAITCLTGMIQTAVVSPG